MVIGQGGGMVRSGNSRVERSADRIVASLALPARRASASEVVPLPVMDLASVVESSSVGLSLVRVDHGGVVAGRAALSQLGWIGGQPVGFDVSVGLIVVTRSADRAAFRVSRRMSLFLPARVRGRCRVRPGEQVLLGSLADHDLLIVYPQHVVHQMLIGHRGVLSDGSSRTGG